MQMLGEWSRAFFNLIYPEACELCGMPMGPSSAPELCSSCEETLFKIETIRCTLCGWPEESWESSEQEGEERLCQRCREERPLFGRARSLYAYGGGILELLQGFKYRGSWRAGKILGRLFAEESRSFFLERPPFDIIAPVPLHRRKLRARGFNQAWFFVQQLEVPERTQKIPTLLRRIQETHSQAQLSFQERKQNLLDAFALNVKYKESVKGKRILIVDDVLTTGATANGCARALLEGGVKEVEVLSLCRGIV